MVSFHNIRNCYLSQDALSVLNQYIKYERHTGVNAVFTAKQPVTKVVSRISYRTVHEDWHIQHTVRYTELASTKFQGLWDD